MLGKFSQHGFWLALGEGGFIVQIEGDRAGSEHGSSCRDGCCFLLVWLRVELYVGWTPDAALYADALTPSSCLFPSLSLAAPCAPSPQMSRSASTFSLSDSTKSGAVVQRSNSLDHPLVRPRVSIALRVPYVSSQIPTPTPKTGPESCQGILPTKCLQNQESQSVHKAPNSPVPQLGQSSCQQTSTTSVDLPPLQTSKPSQPKSGHQLPFGGCHSRLLVYRNLQVDPHRGVKNSPQRETLL